jgi:hypothetical protein
MAQLHGKQIKNTSINVNEKLNINTDLNFSGQSITNLRAASASTEAVIYSQITGLTSTIITGGTVSNGALVLANSTGGTVNVTGNILQSISGNEGLSASTFSNGSQTIGINADGVKDYHIDFGTGATQVNSADLTLSQTNQGTFTGTTVESALEQLYVIQGQKAVQTTLDKDLTPTGTTSGNEFSTGLAITNTPTDGCYVRVDVNGSGQSVGNGVKTKDCYFSADGGTTAKAIGSIVATDVLYWNGTIAGFQLDTTDTLALYYEILA